MSQSSCDPATTPPEKGSVVFAPPPDLVDVPPASPNGRVFYENLGIRIDRDGLWHYHGSPIRRKELVCLFASALVRDGKGAYWLVTPAEIGRVEVEDTPFLAVELFKAGQGERQSISFRTNVDQIVTVDDAHPLIISHLPKSREPAPHVMLDRRLEARLTRSVYYELVSLGEETEIAGYRCLAVWSGGCRFPLGWSDEAS